jgi:hypothetical protein
MAIAVTGHTTSKWPSIGLVMIAWLTTLAVLTLIAHWTGAALNPVGWWSCATQLCCIQMNLIYEAAGASCPISTTDADGLDIREYSHEVFSSQAGSPAKFWIFMQAENIVLELAAWQWIILFGDCQRDANWRGITATFNDDILNRGADCQLSAPFWTGSCTNFQLKAKGMVIAGTLITEKTGRGNKIDSSVFGFICCSRLLHSNKLGVAVKSDGTNSTAFPGFPVAVSSREIADNLT